MLAIVAHKGCLCICIAEILTRGVKKPPRPRAPGQVPDSVLTDGPRVSLTAEEVRKLKARVEELENSRVLYHDVKTDRSSRDRLQAEAPSLGPGLGKAELDSYGQEAIWLFVRNKLMTEQENGESRPEHWAWVALGLSWGHYSASLLFPAYPSITLRGKREQGWDPISLVGKLSPGEIHCSRSM